MRFSFLCISQQFSFFPRREHSCCSVVRVTRRKERKNVHLFFQMTFSLSKSALLKFPYTTVGKKNVLLILKSHRWLQLPYWLNIFAKCLRKRIRSSLQNCFRWHPLFKGWAFVILNYNHGQIHWDNTAFYVPSDSFSNILCSFKTLSPLFHSMLFGENKVKTLCRTESGPLYAQHWLGGEGEAPGVWK